MFKKLVVSTLALVMIISLASSAVMAVPYTEIKIGDGTSTIVATDFDSGEYERSGTDGNRDIRPDEDIATEYGESEFGGNIGWINDDMWVQYTVDVEFDGKYKFEAWIASDAGVGEGSVTLYYDGNQIGTAPEVSGDGWQVYSLYTIGEVDMTAGTHVIKSEFLTGINFAAIIVTCLEKTTAPVVEEVAAAPVVEEAAPVAVEEAPVVVEAAPAPVAAPVAAPQTSDAALAVSLMLAVLAASAFVTIKKVRASR